MRGPYIALAAVVIGVLASVAYVQYLSWTTGSLPEVARLTSPHGSEEDWLVATIVADLADTIAFAATGSSLPARSTVHITRDASGLIAASIERRGSPTLQTRLAFPHSTWAPEDYDDFVQTMIRSVAFPPASVDGPHDEGLIGRLLEPRADVIETENAALSRALAQHPNDPRLHEDAAFLLGVFALREAAGAFGDARQVLCRMTAHLAVARALRASSPEGWSGRLAEALLATLAERGAEAEAQVERLDEKGGTKELAAWRRILMLRTTEDWRIVGDVTKASLGEQLAWLRAVDATLGSARAQQMLEQAPIRPGPEPDWALLLARNPSVEVGNMYLDYALEAVLYEVDQVWSRSHAGALSSKARISALNEPAQPFLTPEGPRVVAWGTWAAMYQRHILHLLRQTEYHERHMLGLKKDAERFAAEETSVFSKLTLFPLLAACWEEEEKKSPAEKILQEGVDAAARHPELLTFAWWQGIQEKGTRHRLPRMLPPRATWFKTGCVRGTTYDIAGRGGRGLPELATPEALNRLSAVAPRSYWIARLRAEAKNGKGLTLADVREWFGERLEYDTRALWWAEERASEEDPRGMLDFTRQRAKLDPGTLWRFGATCVDQGDEACAVEAYERMMREDPDSVRASNLSQWLLKYYLRRGRIDDARALAKTVSRVGSFGGFLTMVEFLEATGDFQGAERWIKRARERYPIENPDTDPDEDMISFYYRLARVHKLRSYEGTFTKLTKKLFPHGLERVELTELKDPPEDGAEFTSETPALRRADMHTGDVVVACDGWRVRNFDQYSVVRAFDDTPEFRLIVWQKARYTEVQARRQGRRFGAEMRPYKPAKR